MKNNWKKVKLGDFAEINPKISLKKNEDYSFIPMEDVSSNKVRYVISSKNKKYTGGGAKFKNGDTLFARITPCLQNGKISQVKNLKTEFGFGSTEFIVFGNRENISDPSFVYYLAISDVVKKPAEKSMSGATGRQRAEHKVIQNFETTVPDLPTQKKIAGILSGYDDLIENNNRRIKILEEMAQAVYKQWFVDFKFPGYEKVKMIDSSAGEAGGELGLMPEGWNYVSFAEIFDIKYGNTLPKTKIKNDGTYPVYGAGGIIGYYDEYNSDERISLVTCRGNGSGKVSRTREIAFVTNNSFLIKAKGKYAKIGFSFVFLNLLNSELATCISGSAQPQITIEGINTIKTLVPDLNIANSFEKIIVNIFNDVDILYVKSNNLRQTRDLLLPKLMNGEMEI